MGDAREEYAEYVRKGGVVPGLWYWIHALRLAGGYAIQEGGVGDMGAIFKDLKFGARALMRMPGATNGQQNPQRSGFGDIPLAVVPRTQGKAGGG